MQMFKKLYLTPILLIAMLILGACGTETPENKPTTGTTSSEQEPTEDLENDEQEEEEEQDSDEEEPATEPEDDEETTEQDKTQDNTEEDSSEEDNNANNENEEETDDFQASAEQIDSDAQDFSIHILPDYTLTSEEPGRDSLYLTEDGNIFMRIETMPFDQENYDYFKENTMSLLESTKADGETVAESSSLPQGESIKDPVGYTVKTNESVLTGFVFEKDGLLVRLTIFDTLAEDHFNNFLHMGETITTK